MYGEQMVRMLQAVDLISSARGATKQELVDSLGVDVRTVERLPGTLQDDLGFPLYEEVETVARKYRPPEKPS